MSVEQDFISLKSQPVCFSCSWSSVVQFAFWLHQSRKACELDWFRLWVFFDRLLHALIRESVQDSYCEGFLENGHECRVIIAKFLAVKHLWYHCK